MEKPVAGSYHMGFTLIELSVVVLVIAMAAVLVFPLFQSPDSVAIRKSARETAAFLRYLHDHAVTTKGSFNLYFNIAEGSMTVAKLTPGGEESAPSDPYLRTRRVGDGVAIADVLTSRTGKTAAGQGVVEVGPGGFNDLLMIHLVSEGNRFFTVTAFPSTGKVTVSEGYQENTL